MSLAGIHRPSRVGPVPPKFGKPRTDRSQYHAVDPCVHNMGFTSWGSHPTSICFCIFINWSRCFFNPKTALSKSVILLDCAFGFFLSLLKIFPIFLYTWQSWKFQWLINDKMNRISDCKKLNCENVEFRKSNASENFLWSHIQWSV